MSNSYKLIGKAVIGSEVIDNAAICVDDGLIVYAGKADASPEYSETVCTDGLIVPGFVDVHCHAGNGFPVEVDPDEACGFHLKNGTTTMCATMYRDLGIDGMLKGADKIMNAKVNNIYGVHLEGPYLNPIYGSKSDGIEFNADYSDYEALINHPFIKHVTYAPEVKGTDRLVEEMVKRNIAVSIGHSSASYEQVTEACKKGAKNVTHLYDATGSSISPTRWGGTIEVDFNAATLSQDDITYEIICDREGIHVRYEIIRLTARLVGTDRIIGITDCCGAPANAETDVYFLNGELSGSRLTMNQVFRNLLSVGFTIPEVVKMTSTNAAKFLGVSSKIGSIEVGKFADLVVLDDNCNVLTVYKSSESSKL